MSMRRPVCNRPNNSGRVRRTCAGLSGPHILDELGDSIVADIADRVNAIDLLWEYNDLTLEVATERVLFTLADLASLCAVAIARVQLLEARMEN
jgi:hypothetical protein